MSNTFTRIRLDESQADTTVENQELAEAEKKASELVGNVPNKKSSSTNKQMLMYLALMLTVVLVGAGSGYGLHRVTANSNGSNGEQETGTATVTEKLEEVENLEVGSFTGEKVDASVMDTQPEGVLLVGGLEGVGTHRILRPGGPSKTVVVYSSTVNLDPFEGHKVRIWGETHAEPRVGWFVDVTGVEVMQLDADLPFEEATPTSEPSPTGEESTDEESSNN